MFGQPVFWRDTMKPARFLIFDGRVVLVLAPVFMHLRPWTLLTAVAAMMVFWWFDRKGVSADSILRFIRARIVGGRRTARGVFEERLPVDFGFECLVCLAAAKKDSPSDTGPVSGPAALVWRRRPFGRPKGLRRANRRSGAGPPRVEFGTASPEYRATKDSRPPIF